MQVRRPRAHVFQCELLNLRAVQQFLLERIGVAHAGFHNVPRGQSGLKSSLHPHPREALPRRNGYRHTAKHSAQCRLRRVEIAMRVNEHHAHAQRLRGWPGMLQTAEHSQQSIAVREQTDGQISTAPFVRHQLCHVASGQR